MVPQALALPFGAQESPGRPLLEALTAYLRPRSVLVVLDNCEHLVDACARLVERVLTACPRVRVMATSREPLRLPGEQELAVAPLAVPDRKLSSR